MERELDNPKNPDMSPEAIDERFRMVEALRKLCLSLTEAGERGPIGDARETQSRAGARTGATR